MSAYADLCIIKVFYENVNQKNKKIPFFPKENFKNRSPLGGKTQHVEKRPPAEPEGKQSVRDSCKRRRH